jgi:hypothetical protein
MGIRYELREDEVDPEDLAAESVAAKIGLPAEQLFKTLVAEGDRHGICMAVVPADTELDVKALAAASGDRKIQLVPLKELQKLTGYIRWGSHRTSGEEGISGLCRHEYRTFRRDFDLCGNARIADSPCTCGLSEGRECNASRNCPAQGLGWREREACAALLKF